MDFKQWGYKVEFAPLYECNLVLVHFVSQLDG